MAEHLHGYPRCETPAGQACPATDVNYSECQAHGALESCVPSVVDGVPTSQYHCTHRDKASAAPAKRSAGARPKKKAVKKKAAGKSKGKGKAKKAAKKPARKAERKPAKKAGKIKKKK